MIKEIIWDTPFSKILEEVESFHSQSIVPYGLSKSKFNQIKEEFRHFLYLKFNKDLKDQKIYATGHQPEIFHPGLMFKDLILTRISEVHNAFPLHIIVDTDMYEFIYYYILKKERNVELQKFELHDNRIFFKEDISFDKKLNLIKILNEQLVNLESVLPDLQFQKSKENIEFLIHEINSDEKLFIISEKIKNRYLNSISRITNNIRVSEIITLPSFQLFVENILERQDDFVKIHNKALLDYRQLHKIKNHAQPIPDLCEDEMPFWILDNDSGKRIPASKFRKGTFLPRAITLTMFLRLFGCDFFIHGKGGARYESVSDETIHNFYKYHGAPYRIGTATMHLDRISSIDFPIFTEKELDLRIRNSRFSPELFLEDKHPLFLSKKELQEKFKIPSENKKELHMEIQAINEKIHSIIKEKIDHLESMKLKFPMLHSNEEVFSNRTFPFFYYNMKELESFVSNLN
jgi:hypothetical protein